jgi:hypothetical protein
MLTADQVSLFNSNDFVVVPVVVSILLLIIRKLKKSKFKNNLAKNLILPALLFKIVLTFVAAYLNEYAFGYHGDTHYYYSGVLNIRDALLEDPTFIQYGFSYDIYELEQIATAKPEVVWMANTPVCKVAQIATPFSFFMGNSYLGISLIFSFFSFWGLLKLFEVFCHEFPALSRQFAYGLFFFPSLAYWSSGLLKDSLSMCGLGLFVYSTYSIFILKKGIFKNLFAFLTGIYLIAIIKPYILIALIPAFSIWIFRKSNEKIKSKKRRYIRLAIATIIFCFVVFGAGIYLSTSDTLQQFAMENMLEEIKRQQTLYEEYVGDSNFSFGSFDPTPLGLLKLFPTAVYTAIYRPFLWEVNKPIQYLSAVESFFFVIFTIYVLFQIGIKKFVSALYSNKTVFFCIIFTFIFAGFVGISTPNFGSLVRYKIPCLPFYLAALIILLSLKIKKNVRNSSVD